MDDLDLNGLIVPPAGAALASPAGPSGRERRRAPRQRTLLGGKLVHSNGLLSMNCVLRNLSETGARLSLPPNTAAPDTFDLIDLKHGEAFACRVVWRQYPMIGVAFDARDRLDTGETARLKSLKRLWLDAITRG
jgi:hypothetical protein